jgi:hypothetical protein
MTSLITQNAFATIEFGVCLDSDQQEAYFQIPIDANVQRVINEMFDDTFKRLRISDGAFDKFEPAQKYFENDRLIIDLTDPSVEKIKLLYEAKNLAVNGNALKEVRELAYYFAFGIDDKGIRVLGVHRAAHFKGILKAHLVSFKDTLRIVDDTIFKLDNNFDYVIKDNTIYILRPSGFEFTASLDESFESRALTITKEVSSSLQCVDFESMRDYIKKHKRAIRLMASLKMRNDLNITSLKNIKRGCKNNTIQFDVINGKVRPRRGFELDFLEFLDRHRFSVSLVPGQPEYYIAPNRKIVQPHQSSQEGQDAPATFHP